MGTRQLYWILTGPSFALWAEKLSNMEVSETENKC